MHVILIAAGMHINPYNASLTILSLAAQNLLVLRT